MFYLSGNDFPQNAPELAAALLQPLHELFTFSREESAVVRVNGGQYPDVNQLRIDLSGASLKARQPPPKPAGVGQSRAGLHASALEVLGHPVRVQEAPIHFDVTATDVRFAYDRNEEGRPLLLLTAAEAGQAKVEIGRGDLEALLLAQASAAAAKQGVSIEKVKLTLAPLDTRSVAVAVRATAKKLFARADLEVKGRLTVDERLNARVSALSCHGDGIVGGLAGNLIRPYLERFNNTELPLTGMSLGNVRLHDLRLDVTDSLKVEAAFGSST